MKKKKKQRRSWAILHVPIPSEEELRGMPDIARLLRDSGDINSAKMYEKVKSKATITDVESKDGMVRVNMYWYGPPYFD